MALGGGNFLVQNKTLPGSYINFVSRQRATASLSDRGYAAMPLLLDWGPSNQVITVTNEDFIKNSFKLFGYSYSDEKLKGLRDLFSNASTLYTYRVNGGGKKAENSLATAKYEGSIGNTIKTAVEKSYTLNDEISGDSYTEGTYIGNMTFDEYISMAMNEQDGTEGTETYSWEIASKATEPGTKPNKYVCLCTGGKIGAGKYGVKRGLQVTVPKVKGKCNINVFARLATIEAGNVGLYKFVLDDDNSGNIEKIKFDSFTSDDYFKQISFEITEAGTYYIGGESGGIYIANVQLEMYSYGVNVYFNGEPAEVLVGEKISELKSEYVDFKSEAVLSVNAGLEMSGGTDGTVSALKYQQALTALESYSFNTLGCISSDETVKKLFVEYTKRLRDECGVKFQCVLHNYEADYEGVINVVNAVSDGVLGNELVYWVTGTSAGCMVNKSITNSKYTGEYNPVCNYSQSELTECIKDGMLVFHKVNDEIRVLKDINSLVSVTDEKNNDFCLNQVIRVLDQIGNDVAVIFNDKYCGKVSNDNAGRTSLWNDIVKLCNQLESIRAIENFNDDNCLVQAGENKTSVIVNLDVTPTCAMDTLYMTVYVS